MMCQQMSRFPVFHWKRSTHRSSSASSLRQLVCGRWLRRRSWHDWTSSSFRGTSCHRAGNWHCLQKHTPRFCQRRRRGSRKVFNSGMPISLMASRHASSCQSLALCLTTDASGSHPTGATTGAALLPGIIFLKFTKACRPKRSRCFAGSSSTSLIGLAFLTASQSTSALMGSALSTLARLTKTWRSWRRGSIANSPVPSRPAEPMTQPLQRRRSSMIPSYMSLMVRQGSGALLTSVCGGVRRRLPRAGS
mmetsp:Transcript_48945/g.113444  ORF Transcript_48945/g.113444 Transcript_48945/m.113444 type:complete len:249 (+) Transcript_48945:981-1727(+)